MREAEGAWEDGGIRRGRGSIGEGRKGSMGGWRGIRGRREHKRGGEDKYVAFWDKNLRNSKKSTKFAADLRNSRKSKVERPQACLLKAES